MPVPKVLKGRYEIREVLGKGGMGVVYKAFDTVLKRDLALKTILDIADQKAVELFHKEYEVLASISHPNIVEIFDLGEYEEDGESIPYFVMPLLSGMPLDKVIKAASHRLTVERSVDIISQTCRGLQAAHERGLVHRDLKPSNVFVMDDDSARIIDFGVVHKTEHQSTKGMKGTLLYMPPELIEMKTPTPLSDIFSLGVVAYETLTQRKPFERGNQYEIIQALLHYVPPPASEINPTVNPTVSRVVHKAMAKQPYHRFSTAREFAETLQKALRNEPIEIFDPARIQPRIQRATKAFEQGDFQFADEILRELEAEGHIDQTMSMLRRKIDQGMRHKRIQQLLESARTRFEEKEYPLALQKVQQVLDLEPDNAVALALRNSIETKYTEDKIEDWFRLVRQHIDNHAYTHARQALENVVQMSPSDTRARQMKAEIDRLEDEYLSLHKEKEQLYQSAVDAWQKGEISSALLKLERALDLDRRAPDSAAPERGASYQNLYNQVRSEHDAMNSSYAEARKLISDREFGRALEICDQYLAKYPGHALFQALKFDVGEQQRQELSRYIAELDNQIEAEPDLDKRVSILKEALNRFPNEAHFERTMRLTREKRDLVASIVAKAHLYEERAQYGDALGQWEILSTIYEQYPGLNVEMDRIIKRRLQQERSEAKAKVVAQVDRQLHLGNHATALDFLQKAKTEFPDDAELAELEKLAQQGVERAVEAAKLLAEGEELCAEKKFDLGFGLLREARQLDEGNPAIRAAMVTALVERAKHVLDSDWRSADDLVRQALELDPSNALGKSVRTLAQDQKREELVTQCISKARQKQTSGDIAGALKEVEAGLASYPEEPRLTRLQETLKRELKDSKRRDARRQSLQELGRLEKEAETIADVASLKALSGRIQEIAQKGAQDPEVRSMAAGIESRLESKAEAAKKAPSPLPASQASFSDEGTAVFRGIPDLSKGPAVPPPPPSPPPQPAFSDEGTAVFRGIPDLSKEPAVPPPPPSPPPQPAFSDEGTAVFRGIPDLSAEPAVPSSPAVAPPQPTFSDEGTAVFRGSPALGKEPSAPAAPIPAQPTQPAARQEPTGGPETSRVAKAPGPAQPTPPAAKLPIPVRAPTAPVPTAIAPPAPARTQKGMASPPTARPAATAQKVAPPIRRAPAPPASAGPVGPPELEETRIRDIPKIEMPASSVPQPPEAPAGKRSPIPFLVGGAVVLLLILAAGGYFAFKHLKPKQVGPTVAIEVQTSPAGAKIKINEEDRGTSNLQLDLPPGSYNLQAVLPGYQTEATKLEVKLGAPASIDLTLQALPQTVRLYTDLASGSAKLNGNPVGELQGGELILDSLLPGKHNIEVDGGKSQASLSVETAPGALPVVTSPVTAKELKVVVFANLGSDGRVYTSFGPVNITLDGQRAGNAGPDGLAVNNLTPGRHELLLGEGADQRKIGIEAGSVPSVTAFMSSDRDAGTLVVVTGEDNVRVLINGREIRRKTQRGQLRIPNLDVKAYEVQVVKDGFQPVPAQQAEIRKGTETQVVFRLTPVPSVASMQIQGAPPGAQVLLGQRVLGSVRDDGTFSTSGISPGEHAVEIRKEGFRSKRLTRMFGAGETLRLGGNEVVLEAAQGMLHLNVSPPDAQVTIALVGDPQTRVVRETTLNLPEGTYILRAKAPNYASGSVSVRISAGETKSIELKLTGERTGEAGWENASAWTREGNWLIRKGGGISLYGATPTAGRFVFTITLRKGKRLQWVLNHTDGRNYALFQTDKKNFYRSVVRNGSTQELAKVPMPVEYSGYYTIQIRIGPGSVVHELFNGKAWVPLDSWTDPGTNVTAGKFGILVQGNDEVGISNFAFYPQ
ncbi:MAG: protein kinase [Acidobacteria bacterium]|nr:protein kinase [Acidobacteriota bacterium]